MKNTKKYIKILLALFIIAPLIGATTTYATDNKSLDGIKIDASNYNQYREQLELDANGDNIIDRTTYKDYKFGTYGRVHVDGWNVEILSFDKVEDGYYAIKFKAKDGYKLPNTKTNGGEVRFTEVEDFTTDGKVTYTIEGQDNEQEKVGVLTFKPKASKDVYDATPILVRLVGGTYNETDSKYLSSYAFVGVHHNGIGFNADDVKSGISFQLDGSRSYLVKLTNGKASLKVYYVDQAGFKPIETVPSKTGVSYQHDDFRNRYQVIDGIRGDTFGNKLTYDATIFNVQVYNVNTKKWEVNGYYDFYHDNNSIKMPSVNDERFAVEGKRVVGYYLQTLKYEPKMANESSWVKESVAIDHKITTNKADYNVQWVSTGVDGGTDQFRLSSLRLRAGNVFISALYEDEYTVRFLDHDGVVLNSQKVLKGKDASAPKNPSREGYTFEGWDKEFTNIQGNLDVHATYKQNEVPVEPDTTKVKVTFVDYNGTVLKEESLDKGGNATAPTSPQREGYKFVGWDKTFTNVQENLTVKALYEVENEVVLPLPPETPDVPTPPTPSTPPTDTPPVITVPETPAGTETPAPANPTVNVTPVVREDNQVDNNQTNNEQTVIEDQDVPQGNGDTVIDDNQTPLAKIDGAWALINLICVVLTFISGLILVILKHKDEEEKKDCETEYERVEYRRRRWTKFFSVFVTIISIIVFILTEDMTLPMQFVDKYTFVMAVILIVQLAVLIIGRQFKKQENENINVNEG